jgi:hypothetical protein
VVHTASVFSRVLVCEWASSCVANGWDRAGCIYCFMAEKALRSRQRVCWGRLFVVEVVVV